MRQQQAIMQASATSTSVIKLPLSSSVEDVRPNAQSNGRASLHFFLTAILGQSCSPAVAQFIQVPPGKPSTVLLSKMKLREFASDLLLWNSIQAIPRRIELAGFSLDSIIVPEPIRWLYGNVTVIPPVTWAPDIILTASVELAVGPVFDASRGK